MWRVIIKQDRLKNFRSGHPWIFSGAIHSVRGEGENGGLCRLEDESGNFLAVGYLNEKSDIAVRVISRREELVDAVFFERRFAALKDERERLIGDRSDAYRLVFSEADFLPGLIVDRYGDVLVLQCHTLGMELLKPLVVEALAAVFAPRAIYERSDVGARRREGLDDNQTGLLYGVEPGEAIITENGLRFAVDVANGQKTGFYLDQRENRAAILPHCKNCRVLNCFSYTGGFAVYAAKGGATQVVSIDVSKPALKLAEKNFELNGFKSGKFEFIAADVFDFLPALPKNSYDVIILDPPSFAKTRWELKSAFKAYTTINSKALAALKDGGILATSSCTGYLDELTFIKILHQSSTIVGCDLKTLKIAAHPPDHPYNLSFPEGRYLKFLIVQKTPRP
ncbi:MAG: class I SAM-dependent methyltransferase [Myxococcota bacterium]